MNLIHTISYGTSFNILSPAPAQHLDCDRVPRSLRAKFASGRYQNLGLSSYRTCAHRIPCKRYCFPLHAPASVFQSPQSLWVGSAHPLTQNFRKIQNKTPRPPFQFKESPVRGDLVKNHVAESFLTVQRLLPEEYRGIQFNMEEFLSHRYLHELFYSNVSATIARSLWKELRSAAEALLMRARGLVFCEKLIVSRESFLSYNP